MSGTKGMAHSNAAVVLAEGKLFAWDRRLEGLTVRQIAPLVSRHLGRSVTSSTVQRWLMAVRDARLKEAGMLEDAYKQMELDKLDRDEARLAKIINGVDDEKAMAAIRTRVRVAQRRAALIGVDAPTRQTLTVISEDVIDAELRRLEEELGSRGVVKSDTA